MSEEFYLHKKTKKGNYMSVIAHPFQTILN